jgi:hypothetical protein
MKSIAILGLAGLALGSTWEDTPAESTVTEVAKVTGTYCPKTGMYTKPAVDGECVYSVTTVTKATATVTAYGGVKTITVPASTKTETKTETVTAPYPSGTKGPGKCVVTDAKAEELVKGFATLLEYTSYNGTQGAPGRGYKYDVSAATLATDVVDTSDSINFMAGFPLGSTTFPNKAAFDYGQGVLQPEVNVKTLGVHHDCGSITWRWQITPKLPNAYPVKGVNYFEVNEAGLINKIFAEFNNGAWLQSFGRQCAINPVSVAPSS